MTCCIPSSSVGFVAQGRPPSSSESTIKTRSTLIAGRTVPVQSCWNSAERSGRIVWADCACVAGGETKPEKVRLKRASNEAANSRNRPDRKDMAHPFRLFHVKARCGREPSALGKPKGANGTDLFYQRQRALSRGRCILRRNPTVDPSEKEAYYCYGENHRDYPRLGPISAGYPQSPHCPAPGAQPRDNHPVVTRHSRAGTGGFPATASDS